jgi:hypothetical protein
MKEEKQKVVKYGQVFNINGTNYMLVKSVKYSLDGKKIKFYPTVLDLNTCTIIPLVYSEKMVKEVSDLTMEEYDVSDTVDPLSPYYPKSTSNTSE